MGQGLWPGTHSSFVIRHCLLAFPPWRDYDATVIDEVTSKKKESGSPVSPETRAHPKASSSRKEETQDNQAWLESLESVWEHLVRTQGSNLAPSFVDNLVDRLRKA